MSNLSSEQIKNILNISKTDTLDSTIINLRQALDISKELNVVTFGLCDLMEPTEYKYPLDLCLDFIMNNGTPIERAKPNTPIANVVEINYNAPIANATYDEPTPTESPLAPLARSIAMNSMRNATSEEEIQQATREMNAAEALSKGNVGDAFRCLDYFRDR